MRILGIDPGTGLLGFGVIEASAGGKPPGPTRGRDSVSDCVLVNVGGPSA